MDLTRLGAMKAQLIVHKIDYWYRQTSKNSALENTLVLENERSKDNLYQL